VAAGPVGEAVGALARGDPAALARALARLRGLPRGEALAAALDMLAAGAAMMLDDARDVGRFDRLHHWQGGAFLAVAATLLLPALVAGYGGDRSEGGGA